MKLDFKSLLQYFKEICGDEQCNSAISSLGLSIFSCKTAVPFFSVGFVYV